MSHLAGLGPDSDVTRFPNPSRAERFSVECCQACPLRSVAVAAVVPLLDAHGLSRRELEVVRLLADGLTNAEIGKRLWLAEKTIKGHLSNVHYKLDTRNRTEVAVWAVRNGLA